MASYMGGHSGGGRMKVSKVRKDRIVKFLLMLLIFNVVTLFGIWLLGAIIPHGGKTGDVGAKGGAGNPARIIMAGGAKEGEGPKIDVPDNPKMSPPADSIKTDGSTLRAEVGNLNAPSIEGVKKDVTSKETEDEEVENKAQEGNYADEISIDVDTEQTDKKTTTNAPTKVKSTTTDKTTSTTTSTTTTTTTTSTTTPTTTTTTSTTTTTKPTTTRPRVIIPGEEELAGDPNVLREKIATKTEKNSKIVLFWDPDFLHRPRRKEWDMLEKTHCGAFPCYITVQRQFYPIADALVSHFPLFVFDSEKHAAELPKTPRPKDQLWFYWNKEAPGRTKISYAPYGNLFNASITYRHDSEAFMPYGMFTKRDEKNIIELKKQPPINHAAGRKKKVAWVVSNCNKDIVHSLRMEYAKELQKYIEVDIYGDCGTMPCDKEHKERCSKMITDNYKFYLAFENMLCKDYVTEKFFRTLRMGVIPIVMGAYDYSTFPPNVAIDIRDYGSPKQLAEYLHKLDADDAAYNQYFEWNKEYEITGVGICQLCEFLHKNPGYKNVLNLADFWSTEKYCLTPEVYYRNSADDLLTEYIKEQYTNYFPWFNHKF